MYHRLNTHDLVVVSYHAASFLRNLYVSPSRHGLELLLGVRVVAVLEERFHPEISLVSSMIRREGQICSLWTNVGKATKMREGVEARFAIVRSVWKRVNELLLRKDTR